MAYLPGIAVNRVSGAYRGEGRRTPTTIIADQAHMRHDLREMQLENKMIAELRVLTAQWADIAADRTRAINRLRVRLPGVFPALDRDLDFTNRDRLLLISQFQPPQAISEIGQDQPQRWHRDRKVRGADRLAAAAVTAAAAKRIRIRGEAVR